MTRIIPVASGKGGVGKSTLVANLGLTLAAQGKTVLLVDLDLGGSNLHTFLGIKNNHDGLASYIFHGNKDLESLIVETPYPRLYFIPGDGLIPGTANLPFFVKKRLLNDLQSLVADVVILDLGAGSSHNVIDFFLLSSLGLMVTVPETVAVLNAYGFLKSALYRRMALSFPFKSEERGLVEEFSQQKLEGSGHNILDLIDQLYQKSRDSGRKAQDILTGFRPGVVINMGRTKSDGLLAGRLQEILKKNLSLVPSYLGYLPFDPQGREAVNQRTPLSSLAPAGGFSQGLKTLASSLIHTVEPMVPELHWQDTTLEEVLARSPEFTL